MWFACEILVFWGRQNIIIKETLENIKYPDIDLYCYAIHEKYYYQIFMRDKIKLAQLENKTVEWTIIHCTFFSIKFVITLLISCILDVVWQFSENI